MKDHEMAKTVNDLTEAAKFFRHTHQLRDQMKGILAQVVERVSNNQQEQIDELKAQVNRLLQAVPQARNDEDREAFERCLGRTLATTSDQCLAEVKAKAIEEVAKKCGVKNLDGTYCWVDCLQDVAKQLREQAK